MALIFAAATARAAPANDSCDTALVISNAIYSHSESTTDATTANDPAPSCIDGFANGVWFQYTPPSDGQLDVDTSGSDFDTGLAIYSGACGSLTELACNDDDLLNGVLTSRLSIQVSSGVIYKFLAGGTAGSSGNLAFHLSLTANGPPLIGTQPTNQVVSVGQDATFTVEANSLSPLSYFWKRGNAFIPGANSASYTFANAQASDSGSQFSCLVSNAYGAQLSDPATLYVVVPKYHFDFESGLQGFVLDNNYNEGHGLWHVSSGRAQDAGHSPTHSLYYGQNEGAAGGGNYNTGTANAGVAVSPALSLPAGPITLSFNYLMAVEPVNGVDADLAYVEVSTDNGATYTTVEQKGAGLQNNTASQWLSNSVDLSAYAGANVRVRFRFDTVDSSFNNTEGWYLDDVVLTTLPNGPLAFQTVSQTNGQIQFTWNAAPGQDYQVQYKTNLSQTNWINLGPPLTNAVLPYSDGLGPDTQRFYRVRTAP
ncbi:MAG TPA: choice-of-anchor J domain-containing protein [Verrucomicrobiae bacterium]|nr:choice-of-anchor J domain-containing protein [Verrucomicrobiae bacterium]